MANGAPDRACTRVWRRCLAGRTAHGLRAERAAPHTAGMRRSVPPETVQAAEQQRAAMAAAARVQGVLIPPGTTTVILSFDGPVDVPALHNALGRMIADGDMLGLYPADIETRALASGAVARAGEIITIGDADGCVRLPPIGEAPSALTILEDAHEYGQRNADAIAGLIAAASPAAARASAAVDVIDERPAPATPLEHLRAHGPTTAAQLAAALGITRQKAVIELGELVRAGKAVKGDNKTYKAVAREL